MQSYIGLDIIMFNDPITYLQTSTTWFDCKYRQEVHAMFQEKVIVSKTSTPTLANRYYRLYFHLAVTWKDLR